MHQSTEQNIKGEEKQEEAGNCHRDDGKEKNGAVVNAQGEVPFKPQEGHLVGEVLFAIHRYIGRNL